MMIAAGAGMRLTGDSWAAEDSAVRHPASCVVNDGEWYWRSDSVDVVVGVDAGDVAYVDVVLHHAGVCDDLGPQRMRVAIPWPHGWTGADCVWSANLCQGDSLGISMFVIFEESRRASCSFALRRTQSLCERCAGTQSVVLTRRTTTAVQPQLWSTVKRMYR